MPRKPIVLSWSGGKDSAWALHLLRQGSEYEVVALLTTLNETFRRVAIHGFREELLDLQAQAAGLPLWKIPLPFPCTNATYEQRMSVACERAVREGVHGIAFGDLFLEDIRAYRIEKLAPTGLVPIFPVWGIPTDQLARQMIAGGLKARLTCVDPKHLDASFAGREFDPDFLRDLPAEVDPCGERGEFHTFAHAGPMFSRPIPVAHSHTIERDGYAYAELLPTDNHPPAPAPQPALKVLLALLILVALAFATANAQVLARPGWAGSGVTVDPWWKHAVIYEIYPRSFQDSRTAADAAPGQDPGTGDLKGIAARLDYLQALGVDAICLAAIHPSPESAPVADASIHEAIDPNFGTMDDFDTLVEQAGRHHVRVLMEMATNRASSQDAEQATLNAARFWLNRGVAGFRLDGDANAASPASPAVPQAPNVLGDLRKVVASYPGQRVLIAQMDPSATQQPAPKHSRMQGESQLAMDTQLALIDKLDAATFRQRIQQAESGISGTQPLFDFAVHDQARSWSRFGDGVHDQAIAKAIATVLLATRAAAWLSDGEELGPATASIKNELAQPASLLNWHKRLIELRQSNHALRDGANIMLDHDSENVLVWLRKPPPARRCLWPATSPPSRRPSPSAAT